jgi:uncharacterized protein YggE
MIRACFLAVLLFATATVTAAQPSCAPAPEGTLVVIGGQSEAQVSNDEAIARFFVEMQDADVARAQSVVNQRAADGVAALKRADPKAVIETSGYQSYPVYESWGEQKITGWRVRQSVTLRTSELAKLAQTVAAGQQQLTLDGIDFRLSHAARERVEAELIQRAIANLNARVAQTAQSLGVPRERQRIEELTIGEPLGGRQPMPMARMAVASASKTMAEPQLDAGQSTQQLTVSAKVRFLP